MKNDTRLIIKLVITFVSVVALIYLCASFMAWEFNPHNWPVEGRVAFCVCGVICPAILCFTAYQMERP